MELYLSWIQRYIWGELAETSISKSILHYFGVNSISGLTADQSGTEQAETGQFLIQRRWFDPSVTSIGRERTNSLWVSPGVTWITKVQIMMLGKSKVSTVKSRTETHFRKTNISRDLSSRNGLNCSNVICKMLLRSKLIDKSISWSPKRP